LPEKSSEAAPNDKMAGAPVALSLRFCQKPIGISLVGQGDVFANKCQTPKNKRTMNVKPLSDRVLILPNPAEEKTAGGLIIPDTAKEKPLAGKVVAVGPGNKDVAMEVKPGDEVLYGKYAGQELQIEGETYLIMKQNDILAII
jgi:chaperonin GroES